MKKISSLIVVGILCITQACNNSDNKDAVDKANDANDKKDTTAMTSETTKDTMATMPVNDDVAKFAVKVANIGMTEIQLGKMAEEKGTSKAIKDFGTMMVKDHSMAADQLKSLATEKNITLPSAVGDDMQKKINDLSKETGKDFDKDYVNTMVSGHTDAIDAFEDVAKNSKDSAFKNFAVKTLPTLYKHLGAAKALQKSNHF